MFYHKDHISEFLYFSKIHTDLRKALRKNQNTPFAFCVFFNLLGFITILSSRESLRSICCTELKLPPMLSDDALAADNGVYWKKL